MRILFSVAALIALFLGAFLSQGAQDAPVEASGSGYILKDTDEGRRDARRCAYLEAWSRLLESTGGYDCGGVISNRHPSFSALAWALASRVVEEKTGRDAGGAFITVTLRSPEGDFDSFEIAEVKSVEADIDLDGVNETCSLAADGRITIRNGATPRAVSPSLAAFSFSLKKDGWREVRYRSVTDIVWDGSAKLHIETVTERCAGGCLLDRKIEKFETVLSGFPEEAWSPPSIEISSPRDFSAQPGNSMNLRGLITDPKSLLQISMILNGRQWRDFRPGARREMPLRETLLLEPGCNILEIAARNYQGNVQVRELLVRRDAPPDSLETARRRVVLVGINRYWDNQIGGARGCARDVKLLGSILSRPAAGAVPSGNISVLTDDGARRERFYSMLSQLSASGPWDSIIFYFAGLGVRLPGRPPGEREEISLLSLAAPILPASPRPSPSLLFSDSRAADLQGTSLRVCDLVRSLKAAAQRVFLVLDCPFPDRENEEVSDGPNDFEDMPGLTGVTVLQAARAGGKTRGRTDFARLFREGLSGAADEGDGYIEGEEICRYVIAQGAARARRTGDGSAVPSRVGSPHGLLILARSPGAPR